MKDYEPFAHPHRKAELQVHLGIWLLGLIFLGARLVYLRRRQDDQDRVRMALRESEARFRQLFEQNDDALLLFRPENFEVIDVNPMALELLGLTRQDIIGQKIQSFVLAEDFQAFVESGAISDSAPLFQTERATSFSKSKGEITVSLRGKILTLENECIVYCSMRDMTEKVRLMEEIQASQAKLIHADKMASLGLLVSSVAHEINNPNTYISANATMLAQAWQDASPILLDYRREHGEFSLGGLPSDEIETLVPRLFNGIIDGSRRITEIVNNMREFVKTEKSNRQRPVEINRIIQAATSILWHHIHKHTDHFHLELPPAVPPFMGRGQQIEQVVINLIMNALQSLPDKTRGVWVTSRLDDSAGQVVITVRDEGKGMTVEELEQLKEPFFTTKADEGGTGLGLYISDSIIREHGGTLEFQSEHGSGTTATIRLPAAGTGMKPGGSANKTQQIPDDSAATTLP
ncbi:MAG: PAS domain-containing sensor histidine kinase [Geobacter sp.]|nr:MAG: PAS domain-containing sensor histidine kinase [Geobacter sp.]